MAYYNKYKRRLTKTDIELLTADSQIRKRILPKGDKKYEVDYEGHGSHQKRRLKGHFDSQGALHLLAEGVRKGKNI